MFTLEKIAKSAARRYTDGPTVATIPNPTVDANEIAENINRNVLRKEPESVLLKEIYHNLQHHSYSPPI